MIFAKFSAIFLNSQTSKPNKLLEPTPGYDLNTSKNQIFLIL